MAKTNNVDLMQKGLIYRLSRQFGKPITIYKLESSDYDMDEGGSDFTYQITKVKKALVMKSKELRIIGGGLKFGNVYDDKTRFFVFEVKRLLGYVPNLNDYIFYRNERYKMKEIETTEDGVIVAIRAEAVEGQMPQELHEAIVSSNVNLTDEGNS